jgi:alpha-tubulin N-acetyltransferase 1
MGELSSKSQNLLVNVTTTNRFFPSDHTLIIKADKNKVLGYIKVGPKRLFLRDRICNYHERKTLCVLDFYIYDTEQRKGLGKEIFDFMLNYKKINPGELAYDRPTLRFLAFLKRNYGLENYIQQENNFTIYDEFFESERNKNNETQYDSDTHRVIQNLYTPRYLNRSVDFNSNNKYITNINPNYNNNNYRNSPQNNQRNMNIKKIIT